jgi:hypothetical protein
MPSSGTREVEQRTDARGHDLRSCLCPRLHRLSIQIGGLARFTSNDEGPSSPTRAFVEHETAQFNDVSVEREAKIAQLLDGQRFHRLQLDEKSEDGTRRGH